MLDFLGRRYGHFNQLVTWGIQPLTYVYVYYIYIVAGKMTSLLVYKPI